MIKTMAQAIEVQQRRVNAGKPGYAKAVRRWAKRNGEALATVAYWVDELVVHSKELSGRAIVARHRQGQES